jgi:hypothetical protein
MSARPCSSEADRRAALCGVDQDDKRLFVGALCGIAFSTAVSFLLRHHYVHWPAGVGHWLRSKPALYSLSISGLVCQLGGVVLVVVEISRSNWRLWWLDYWFTELGKKMDAIDPKALAEQQAAAYVQGKTLSQEQPKKRFVTPEVLARIAQPMVAWDIAHKKNVTYLEGATNILRTFPRLTRERPAAPAWIGPTLLLLGIVFAGAAGLLGIAAPH